MLIIIIMLIFGGTFQIITAVLVFILLSQISDPGQAPVMLQGHSQEVTSVTWCPTDFTKVNISPTRRQRWPPKHLDWRTTAGP